MALDLARQTHRTSGERDPRLAWRKSHVGYYLIGEGADQLRARAGVRCRSARRVQDFLRRHPDEFYLGGIEVLTLLIVIAIMTPVFGAFNTFLRAHPRDSCAASAGSQSAVEVMNYLDTALLHPAHSSQARFLRRHSGRLRDHGRGAHACCLNEKQVRRLVEDLEVRYLGNSQPQPAFCAADRFARFRRDAQRRRSAGRSLRRS